MTTTTLDATVRQGHDAPPLATREEAALPSHADAAIRSDVAEAPASALAEPEPEPRPRPAPSASWAAKKLAAHPEEPASATLERAALGFALAACYGLAMGLTRGGTALWHCTAMVGAMLAAVTLMALPALYILLALFDAPLSPAAVAREASRALFRTGLLLSGLSPALALYATTAGIEACIALGLCGLFLAGGIGLLGLGRGIGAALRAAGGERDLRCGASLVAFTLFAMALVVRLSSHLIEGAWS